jgi:hypothetical protein
MLTSLRTIDAELTDSEYEQFQLEGSATAVANLSIGTLTLDPIKFNVSSGLWGLKGLKGLVSIDGVDVLGGTQDALSLSTNVTIDNPSSLNLGVGDLGTPCKYPVSGAAKDDYSFQSFISSGTVR